MMKKGAFAVAVVAVAFHACAAQPDLVARVMAGELKEARASWWGFDKEESTRFLQAAIDSRVPRLVVDDMGAPWVADRLMCVSGQEIVFEKGVEVLAKKGAFMGKTDALLTLACVSNVTLRGYGATLRMRRADYDAAPYAKAEWRHVLNIRSSVGIKIYGLTLAESGGDGIYLGCAKGQGTNRDIHIKDVLCDRNYRQGISVISAENLLIEDTVMRDTAGTAPAAGIDFEPNQSGERLKNCVMRNCLTQNNQGDGYEFYLPNLTRASEPVSILIENCRSEGDRSAVRVVTANAEADAVGGEMVFRGCRFERSLSTGIIVSRKPAEGMTLAFEACVVSGGGQKEGQEKEPDIVLSNRGGDSRSVGGIRFSDVKVVQREPRPWIVWQDRSAEDAPVTGLTGTVFAGVEGQLERFELTPAWVAARFPPRFRVHVPRVRGDLGQAQVVDRAEGVQRLSPLRVRRQGRYVFFAKQGQAVVLGGESSRVGRYEASAAPLRVTGPSGKVVQVAMPPFKERAEVAFTAAEEGFHTLEVDVGANAFALLEANVPVALDAVTKAVWLIASSGTLYVSVPEGTGLFALGVAGEGSGEAVKATVCDPSGKVVWSKDRITQMERYTWEGKDGSQAGGMWQVTLGRPAQGGFEDFHVDVLGVPGYLFLNPERYWVCR